MPVNKFRNYSAAFLLLYHQVNNQEVGNRPPGGCVGDSRLDPVCRRKLKTNRVQLD
ncbi:MAG: hypothetical protein LBG58_00190 [Planctomycetaceae bacterium]|nr:hypothetical protein [Planctomycetaceae bacterium]